MDTQEKILQFIRVTGPTLPSKVAKIIHEDTLITSAHLADLSAQKKVKVSDLKVGTSPLYYLSGQEHLLYNFAAGNMNPKNVEALDKLKANLVLRESDLSLLEKVALRQLKDFAVPLQVRTAERVELFWKWHLTVPEQANQIIADILHPPERFVPSEKMVESSPRQAEPVFRASPRPVSRSESRMEPKVEQKVELKVEPKESSAKGMAYSKVSEITSPSSQPAVQKQSPLAAHSSVLSERQERHSERPAEHKMVREAKEKYFKSESPELEDLVSKKPRKARAVDSSYQTEFFSLVEDFFRGNEIIIEQKETIRKGKEINFIVTVPSVVGKMRYFCKFKDKKRCDEKDLSSAYMEAQIKRLPLLFLYTSEMHKKALEMLDTGAFENAVIKRIE
jgi:hypothetical protein